GSIFKLKKTPFLNRTQIIGFFITSALFGGLVTTQGSCAGATSGCPAEVGSASAMAASCRVGIFGRFPETSGHAMA
ncbi:L-serine ammonia-lyase, iron-sulfur-dependent, subunit alpha, partial [Staphylococcus aureus]